MLVALHPGASREDALRTPGIELRRTGKTMDSALPETQSA